MAGAPCPSSCIAVNAVPRSAAADVRSWTCLLSKGGIRGGHQVKIMQRAPKSHQYNPCGVVPVPYGKLDAASLRAGRG